VHVPCLKQTVSPMTRVIAAVALLSLLVTTSSAQEPPAAGIPLLEGKTILFVVRHQYAPDHHATATLFQNGEINSQKFRGPGALKAIEFGAEGSRVRTLLEAPDGVIRDPEVDPSGERVVFSMRREAGDDYHLYEIGVDGEGLRQITFLEGVSDIDPEWLPGGGIVFSSTRDYKFCQCNRHIMANLFRIDADGANVRRIGGSTLFEGHPHVMADGGILYDRWEYVDRHFGPSFGLWSVNPDGSGHALVYGNNAWSPGMIADARMVPNTRWIAVTLGSCHDRPWGALAILDPTRGSDGTAPILHSWPADLGRFLDRKDVTDPSHARSGRIDAFKGVNPKYEDPYPISSTQLLCSKQVEGEEMGIFLLDTGGGEGLLHREKPGCYDPILVEVREAPPILAERRDLEEQEGTFYIADVYRGVGMEEVERGSIAALRVIEAPAKTAWTNTAWNIDATQAPAMNWNLTNNKRILGTVPVETDGSAYFYAPADTFLFFQLLDRTGRMVQSMRSGTLIRPGETIGCAGCHEPRHTTAPVGKTPIAMTRRASRLRGWYGAPRDFNYLTEVQPVFDRRCVECHDGGASAAGGLDLSGDLGLVFNTSYVALRSQSPVRWAPTDPAEPKPLVKAVDDGPPQVLPAYAWGSTASRLVDVILEGHEGVELAEEELDRVITWIDMNAPYYGSYGSAYPDNPFGRSPLTSAELARLAELTGVPLGAGNTGAEKSGSQVSFTRPERSLCLAGLSEQGGVAYEEALGLIRTGSERLVRRPRGDQKGFIPGPLDRDRAEKAAALAEREERSRRAQASGERLREDAEPNR
jgi:hypothetical protein